MPCARRAAAARRTARCTRCRRSGCGAKVLEARARPQRARHRDGRRRHLRLRRSGRRGGRRHPARRGASRPATTTAAGHADQPLLRLRPRRHQFRRRQDHVRASTRCHRRRRRIDVARRHGRVGRRLAHGSVGRHPGLFHAAGHLRRPDRHQIRLLPRRRRRLCGGEPEARRRGLGRRAISRTRSCR